MIVEHKVSRETGCFGLIMLWSFSLLHKLKKKKRTMCRYTFKYAYFNIYTQSVAKMYTHIKRLTNVLYVFM